MRVKVEPIAPAASAPGAVDILQKENLPFRMRFRRRPSEGLGPYQKHQTCNCQNQVGEMKELRNPLPPPSLPSRPLRGIHRKRMSSLGLPSDDEDEDDREEDDDNESNQGAENVTRKPLCPKRRRSPTHPYGKRLSALGLPSSSEDEDDEEETDGGEPKRTEEDGRPTKRLKINTDAPKPETELKPALDHIKPTGTDVNMEDNPGFQDHAETKSHHEVRSRGS